jgi:hypothetical protein
MLLYLGLGLLGLFGYTISRNMDTIKQTYTMYKGFKQTIDPNGKKWHISTMLTFASLAAIKFMVTKAPVKTQHETFNRDYIKISYTYKERPYFYLLKVPKGVTPLSKIVDETGNNVENVITPYLGPNLDCHGISICPKDFGYEKLVVTTVFDEEITFNETDKIAF